MCIIVLYYYIIPFQFLHCVYKILKIISILTVLSFILLIIIAKFYTSSYNIRLMFNFRSILVSPNF